MASKFAFKKYKRMKVEKFKVLLYLKKSGLDKSGKAPIMGRITVKGNDMRHMTSAMLIPL